MRWALAIIAVLLLLFTGAKWVSILHRPAPVVISTLTPAQPSPAQSYTTQTASPPAPAQPPIKPSQPTVPLLYVQVAGAVRHPSLYQLPPGSRVWHAVKAAGGATTKADLDAINLAEKVEDGEKIYVPTRTAQAAQTAAPTASDPLGVRSVTIRPLAPIAAQNDGAANDKPSKMFSPEEGLVDINTAGADILQRLPGIGPAMAERILAYRQQAGRFASTDELMNISGIGPKKYAKIAPMIKL